MTVVSFDLHHTYASDLEKERHKVMHLHPFVPFYPLFCPLFEVTETLSLKEQKSVLSSLKLFYESGKNSAILSPLNLLPSPDGSHHYFSRILKLTKPQAINNLLSTAETTKNWNTFLSDAGFPPYQESENTLEYITSPMIYGYTGQFGDILSRKTSIRSFSPKKYLPENNLPESYLHENYSRESNLLENLPQTLNSCTQEISMRVFRLVVLDIQKPAESHHNINWTETAGIWVKTH